MINICHILSCLRHLLAYLMIPIVQKEIDTFVNIVWNTHRIRGQKNTYLPDGVPNHIYEFPEKYQLEQCGNGKVLINPFSCIYPSAAYFILFFKYQAILLTMS